MAEVLPLRGRSSGEPPPIPDPPDHLSEEAEEMWRAIVEEWVLGPDGLPLLKAAVECFDRYREAADLLREEGPVLRNPDSGHAHAHPAHQVARDNLREFRQCFRQLNLEPPEIQ